MNVYKHGFPRGSVVKKLPINVRDVGLIPGSGRSPGEGNGNLLQYPCLENPMDRGAWWAKSMESQTVGHFLATKQQPYTYTNTHTQIPQGANPGAISQDLFPDPCSGQTTGVSSASLGWETQAWKSNKILGNIRKSECGATKGRSKQPCFHKCLSLEDCLEEGHGE